MYPDALVAAPATDIRSSFFRNSKKMFFSQNSDFEELVKVNSFGNMILSKNCSQFFMNCFFKTTKNKENTWTKTKLVGKNVFVKKLRKKLKKEILVWKKNVFLFDLVSFFFVLLASHYIEKNLLHFFFFYFLISFIQKL